MGHDFGLRQVADPWSPENITWNNQPNTVGEPIIVPGNSYRSRYFDIDYYYPIDVKPLISHMIADSGKNYGIRLATGFDENDSGIITGSIKRNIFYAPGYEGFRENDRRPYLQVRFSNPSWEETIMDAGPVAEGDTVTIAYKNENPAGNRTYFSDNPYTREFNGEEYFGRYLIFYNRNFIDRCQASWPDTEDLWLFAFIEKADESPQFAVEIEPVELEYFQEGALDIKVINPNDPNEILPTDLFEFAVDEAGKSYGGFKRRLDLVSLDQPITTDTKTEQLEKIQAKEIEFFVDRASPEEPVIATITATLKKDPAQTTSTTVNIVPCEPELCPGEAMTKPQQFDAKTNTVMVQAGDTYTWTDRQGNSRSQTIPKFKTQSLGITKPLWTINDLAAPGLEFNYLTDQLNIKACKANSEDQQWNLRAENIVIPIYAEAYLQERGKIDLEDFTYQTFLREVRVQNYDHVQLDLEAFAIGSYAFRFVNEPKLPANLRKQYINPKRFAMLANGQERFVKRIPEVAIYTSRIGVMLHEEEHVRQYRKQLSIEMNRAFNEIYNNRADPLCDGDAKETVKQLLSKAEQKISDNFDRNRYLYELKADRNASRFFDSLVRKLEAHKQKAQQEGKWPQ